jgi:hypothetical protein
MKIVDLLHPDSPTFEDEYHRLSASDSPYETRVGKMMLEFLDRLRRGVIGPQLFASNLIGELCLQYSHGLRHTMIKAKIDHKDCSPLVEGVPILHYRLTYSLPETESATRPKIELRTRDVDEAYEFVVDAIKTCQRDY